MQRLFSTFPRGLPGIALVLLRAAAAIPLLQQGIVAGPTACWPAPLVLLAAAAAVLLLVGLWTPVAGVLVALAALGLAVSHPAEPWIYVHVGTVGAALAMLGPGAWSVDARLFGRKTIQIPER